MSLTPGGRGLQNTLNGFTNKWLKGLVPPLDVDGEVGPESKGRVKFVKKMLGWGPNPTAKWDHDFLEVVRHPRRLSAYPGSAANKTKMLLRGIARRRAFKRGGGGSSAVIKIAARFLGRTENNNRAGWLDAWARKYVGEWMVGEPWCGLFVLVCWALAGKKLPQGVVYTPNIVSWAHQGKHFRAVSPSQAKAGDLVVFNFPGGSPVADHVALARGPARNGMIPTIEGNTSPGTGGSQANGGGVYKRSRPVGLIAVVARPI